LLFEVDVLTALVLGGLPITGGAKVKIRSGIIGSLMIAFLGNGLVLIGASANILQLVKGITFLTAVYLSIDREGMVIIK
jgi:ribose transport system permease protein